MNRYSYRGPVMEFERCVSNNWEGTTYAASEKKARSNLVYQYKRQFNKTAAARITLPGELAEVWKGEKT